MGSADFDETRHAVTTPGGEWRYQLSEVEGSVAPNLFTVWELNGEPRWCLDCMILVDEAGTGALLVGRKAYRTTERGKTEAYMRAAGHIWAARKAGLWEEDAP